MYYFMVFLTIVSLLLILSLSIFNLIEGGGIKKLVNFSIGITILCVTTITIGFFYGPYFGSLFGISCGSFLGLLSASCFNKKIETLCAGMFIGESIGFVFSSVSGLRSGLLLAFDYFIYYEGLLVFCIIFHGIYIYFKYKKIKDENIS
jgi:hypothetical protein